MAAKKARGKSKPSRAKTSRRKASRSKASAAKASEAKSRAKSSARKSTRKNSAASVALRNPDTDSKRTARRGSPGVVKAVKEMAGAVLTAAAAGALKGAVTAAIPPVRKAAGVSEESPETRAAEERSSNQA